MGRVKRLARLLERRWRRLARGEERGAVTVEFAVALMFFFLIFTAYVQITEIFLAHERLRYADNVAARVHAVGGSASRAASQLDKDYTLKIEKSGKADVVKMSKKLELPEAIGRLWGEKNGFTISHSVKTYMEPSQSGDNKAK